MGFEPKDEAGGVSTPRDLGAASSTDPLPMVRLPSAFLPERFKDATRARGARPEALKEIDDLLATLDAAASARERFELLRKLQKAVDQFVLHTTKESPRQRAAVNLKTWVDGAVRLRESAFTKGG